MLQIITLLWKLFNMLYNSFQCDIFWIFFAYTLMVMSKVGQTNMMEVLAYIVFLVFFCVVLHFTFKTLICFMLLLSVMRLMGRLSFPSSFFQTASLPVPRLLRTPRDPSLSAFSVLVLQFGATTSRSVFSIQLCVQMSSVLNVI